MAEASRRIRMPDKRTNLDYSRWRRISRNVSAFARRGPILIVDDNPDDAKLAVRAFQQLNPDFPVAVFNSGLQLITHLEGLGPASTLSPGCGASLILLDLKMPEMDGFEVMKWLTNHPIFGSMPVVVLTNFTDLHHLKEAYTLGARSYLLKPVQREELRSALMSLNISV
jgi:two-component system response regulator